MRKALVGCLLFAVLGAPMFAAENTYSLGGGLVAGRSEVDQGAEIDTTGAFATFRINASNGALLLFSVSASSGDDTALTDIGGTATLSSDVKDDFLHVGVGAGYMFFRDHVFRLFLHGGFAYLDCQETIGGVETVNDSSFGLSVGGGIEAGKGHHAFYLNLGFDYDQSVEYVVPLSIGDSTGRSGFNMLEAQVGYIYNF